jgi:hypothetical protein
MEAAPAPIVVLDAATKPEFGRFRDAGFYAYVRAKVSSRIGRERAPITRWASKRRVTLATVKGDRTLAQAFEQFDQTSCSSACSSGCARSKRGPFGEEAERRPPEAPITSPWRCGERCLRACGGARSARRMLFHLRGRPTPWPRPRSTTSTTALAISRCAHQTVLFRNSSQHHGVGV